MVTLLKQQFLEDAHGQPIGVFLPIEQYNKLLAQLEDVEELRAYDKAKARKQEFVPAGEVFKSIEQKQKHI